MVILSVVGARPNFMKIAPIIREMTRYPGEFHQILVHTGQHYDINMSKVFFEELELPQPNVNLEIGSSSHASQTAQVMLRIEPVVLHYNPDWVIVVGDVNSTVACALVCAKVGTKVAHVEAGLRSFDRTMPEEINRVLTDQIADLLFTPSRGADQNLQSEGIPSERIHFVGNVMIDTLVKLLPKAHRRPIRQDLGLKPRGYVLVTLHRPSNVDDHRRLHEIMVALTEISRTLPVVFPVHPRTHQNLTGMSLADCDFGMRLLEPLSYLDFLALTSQAAVVITDSGGVQEETTYLGIPCLTLRPNTERPVTITVGTNRLVAGEPRMLVKAVEMSLGNSQGEPKVPEMWDGRAAERIVTIFRKYHVYS